MSRSAVHLSGKKIAGARRVVLFVRRFRCGRGGEFLESRIVPERIEHRIEPKQGRGERDIQSQWVRNRERLTVTFATATISKFVQLLELLADYTARRGLN